MPQLKIGAETLHYEDAGSGPALLLLHSLGTASWLWKAEIGHWAASHRVVAPDLRGHGGTTWHGGISTQANAGDVAALMEHLDLQDVVVIGLSMGGVVATRLAAITPTRVRALVLADTFSHQPEGALRVAGIEARLAAMDMPAFARAYAEETLRADSKSAYLASLSEGIARTDPHAYLATTRSLFVDDTRPLLAELDLPVLVLWGDEDQRTPRGFSDELVRGISHARLHVLPQAAHLSNLDQPESFHAAVDQFLNGLDAKAEG